MRIALATCKTLPEPDPDDAPLRAALAARGVDARPLPWDDPNASASGFDLCVLRSTWNYHLAPARFLSWIERVVRTCPLVNPKEAVVWNLHKGYLRELERAGVPVVPTAWLAAEGGVKVTDVLRERGWADIVVKPSISAASYRTRRFRPDELVAAEAWVAEELRERDLMVQPYLDSVEREGERSLVWIAGELTHAVVKRPRFAGSDESVALGARPTAEERALVERALAPAQAQALLHYARVDVMRDARGQTLVSEVELMEPSLFFALCPAALERFVGALLRTAAG